MKKVSVLNNENGFFKFLFVTGVLVFIFIVGIKFGIPYYKYSAFKSEVKELARISVGDIKKTQTQIFEKAKELNLPIEEKDIEVTKKDSTVHVRTSWSEMVEILGLYQKKLYFVVDEEE